MNGVSSSKLVIFEKEMPKIMEMDVFKEADLIVMGTTGASGMKGIFVGSNTQKVVRSVECPVLSVKKYLDYVNVSEIIFVSDFEKKETVTAYRKLKPLLGASRANIHLLKIITPSNDESVEATVSKIGNFVHRAGLDYYEIGVHSSNSPEKGIFEYSQKYNNSIICIATRGLAGFDKFLKGSISQDLVNQLGKPILTIKMRL